MTRRQHHQRGEESMSTSSTSISASFLLHQPLRRNFTSIPHLRNPKSFSIRAAKLPRGIAVFAEPKLSEPFLGFTRTAEGWNTKACMIGIMRLSLVELIFNKGILQMIGVDVKKRD